MKMHYGIARVEFLAAKQEIETMISEGYTFAMIFRKLKEKNKITMSYTSFARYASGRYLTQKEKLQNGNTVNAKFWNETPTDHKGRRQGAFRQREH